MLQPTLAWQEKRSGMVKKREVTVAMVGRAIRELEQPRWMNKWNAYDTMKAALEAALNPPAAPEIPVSEGMVDAGNMSWMRDRTGMDSPSCLPNIYRAMEAKRREEAQAQLEPLWRRKDDGLDHPGEPNHNGKHYGHGRKSSPGVGVGHHRKDDK